MGGRALTGPEGVGHMDCQDTVHLICWYLEGKLSPLRPGWTREGPVAGNVCPACPELACRGRLLGKPARPSGRAPRVDRRFRPYRKGSHFISDMESILSGKDSPPVSRVVAGAGFPAIGRWRELVHGPWSAVLRCGAAPLARACALRVAGASPGRAAGRPCPGCAARNRGSQAGRPVPPRCGASGQGALPAPGWWPPRPPEVPESTAATNIVAVPGSPRAQRRRLRG